MGLGFDGDSDNEIKYPTANAIRTTGRYADSATGSAESNKPMIWHAARQAFCDRRPAQRLWLSLLSISLLGCAGASSIPVVERAQPPSERINVHRVSEGETLYALAWRYNIDPAALARANGLAAPYRIYQGQRLNLDLSRAPRTVASRSAGSKAKASASSAKAKAASRESSTKRVASQQRTAVPVAAATWRWPTRGGILEQYSSNPARPHKGVDIGGRSGQPVYAANHGVVVYAGAGLPAYGNLLIVKHNELYLSAYAHNSRLAVAEGDTVKAGQKIAEMGKSGTTYEHLHFEIRKKGVPVNPLRLLPKTSLAQVDARG